ncbi:hypothetical protein Tco_1352168 [Tanacetum coccineum]
MLKLQGIWAVSRECQKPMTSKDELHHMSEDQELEAHYMYMAQLQEVTPDQVDNSGPIFDDEPMHKVQNNNDNYNVFAMENEHPEQPESSNDIYLTEQGDTNITIDSLDICYDRASGKLKGEIEDFKTKNKSLESSNNHFKEANNELSKTNQLMFKDLKKFQAELDKYNDVNYASKVERVIPTTSVSRPQLKSNQLEDRVMPNNSQGKKQNVEDHRRHFKFSNNKTSVTACNDSLNAKTSNVNFVCVTCGKCVLNDNHDLCVLHYINGVNSRTRQPMAVPVSTREPKHNVNQSVATFSKKTVATDSTVKKSRNITRKLYEQVSKTCSWWYPKYTPSGYNWKPKSQKGNVNPNISMPLGNASRTANILEHKTPRCSTVSNTPLSSKSFAARRDHSIHRTVKFGNDQIAPILGYGDLVQGTITIKRGNDLLTDHVSSDPVHNVSTMVLEQDSLSPNPQSQENVPQVAETVTTSNELELLYSPMFSELLNGTSPVVSKSSAVHAADNSMLNGVGTKGYPLEQGHGILLNQFEQDVSLETDGKMCMFALTMSRTKPKNIKRKTWLILLGIESMQKIFISLID